MSKQEKITDADIEAMIDETKAKQQSLPGMPQALRTPMTDAIEHVSTALAKTKERLAELRNQRAEINDEIRVLVDEEKLLASMVATAAKRDKS